MSNEQRSNEEQVKRVKTDVVLVGAGIMSATLGALLRQLEPEWSIDVYERLDAAAAESSDAWNNAGTGHAANCELNYTPMQADGTVATAKAVSINASFERSLEFWSSLQQKGRLDTGGFDIPIRIVGID